MHHKIEKLKWEHRLAPSVLYKQTLAHLIALISINASADVLDFSCSWSIDSTSYCWMTWSCRTLAGYRCISVIFQLWSTKLMTLNLLKECCIELQQTKVSDDSVPAFGLKQIVGLHLIEIGPWWSSMNPTWPFPFPTLLQRPMRIASFQALLSWNCAKDLLRSSNNHFWFFHTRFFLGAQGPCIYNWLCGTLWLIYRQVGNIHILNFSYFVIFN